jgi:hypothetical protein
MAITRPGAITAAAKAVPKSRENEKRCKSAARTRKWHERQSAERQNEILQTNRTAKTVSKFRENEKRRKSAARTRKWREHQSAERQNEIRQTNRTGHAEGRTCLSEERQSEIRQTNRTGHAEVFARLLEERHDPCAVFHFRRQWRKRHPRFH